MPRGRPKGSKNKSENKGDLTKPNDILETEEYQFVREYPPISNFNPFKKKFMARVYGSLNRDLFKIIDEDGELSYEGPLKTVTKYNKMHREAPDGRKFDMAGWEIK